MPHQYDFNSRFETDGIFWSTSDPAKTFAAHLTVDEKRIKLLPAAELVGPEKLFPQLNEEAVSGVIHGYTTVGQCTLVGLQDIGSPSHLNGITGQIIRARQLRAGLCIVGFHLACSSAQVLSCATCGYAGLENWLPANSKMAFTDEEVSITYRRNPSPLVDLCVLASKLRITLKAG